MVIITSLFHLSKRKYLLVVLSAFTIRLLFQIATGYIPSLFSFIDRVYYRQAIILYGYRLYTIFLQFHRQRISQTEYIIDRLIFQMATGYIPSFFSFIDRVYYRQANILYGYSLNTIFLQFNRQSILYIDYYSRLLLAVYNLSLVSQTNSKKISSKTFSGSLSVPNFWPFLADLY